MSHPSSARIARRRATLISVGMGLFILILKVVAFRWSGSSALQSDAFESIVNVLAATFALGAILFSEKPPDEDHPYGHGKMENFSAVFEGVLICIAAILILVESVQAWLQGPQLRNLSQGLLLNLFAGGLNGLLGMFLVRSGKVLKSQAIEADGRHVLSDFYSTIAIALGVGVVWFTQIQWLDPLIAILMGLWLARTGTKMVRAASRDLLDKEDPHTLQKIVDSYNILKSGDELNTIVTLHGLRTMRAGRTTHVDVHVVVPEFLEVRRAHDWVENFGDRILKHAGLEGEFHSHMDPCMRAYCHACRMDPCPIRKSPFVSLGKLTVQRAIQPDSPEKKRERT